MNVLARDTFLNLRKTERGICTIIENMRPYLISRTEKIIFYIRKNNFLSLDNDLKDEVFQQLQIIMWNGIKNYNEEKGMPFYFLERHVKRKSYTLIRNILDRYKTDKIIKEKMISTDEGYCERVAENIIRDTAIDTLPEKRKKEFNRLACKEILSNTERVGLKNIIKKNYRVNRAFRAYFEEIKK